MTINQKDLYEIIYHNRSVRWVGQNYAVHFILFAEMILFMGYVRKLLGVYASA